jgi:PAS domain S-box-containing protein
MLMFARSLVRRYPELVNVTQALAEGNLDTAAIEPLCNRDDEVGVLARSLKAVSDRMHWYESMLDAIPFPISVTDNDMHWTFINQAATQVMGRQRQDVKGHACSNWGADICKTERCGIAMWRNGKPTSFFRQPGIERDFRVDTAPLLDRAGEQVGHIEVVQDVTAASTVTTYLHDAVECLAEAIEQLAQGNVAFTMRELPQGSEYTADVERQMNRLFEDFNRAVNNVRKMIHQVGLTVASAASAAAEISASTEQLASSTQEQSAQSNEVAAAVEEMVSTIVENARNATRTAEVAAENGKIAGEGGQVVAQTVEKIRRIAEVVSSSAQTVERLGASSQQIDEIVQVIDEIADQTNLLALNAAIEAARAGEQGRGFAVVADEVRKLAERTTKATKEIAHMIQMIQSETQEAVTAMQRGTSEVGEGIRLADQAGEALQRVVAGAGNTVDMVTQIAAASEEQSTTSEQISRSVESITTVTHESARGIQQIAQSTDNLNQLTEELRELVSRFRIESGGLRQGRAPAVISGGDGQPGARPSAILVSGSH